MKLYIVFFRSMEDSPEVTIECITIDEALAKVKFAEAKAEADELTKDHEEDCSWRDAEPWYWYEARMESFDMTEDCKPGDTIYVLVETLWHEAVETTVSPFIYEANAVATQTFHKEDISKDYPEIAPFDEDETFDEALHLCDDSVMVDYYTYVEPVVIE